MWKCAAGGQHGLDILQPFGHPSMNWLVLEFRTFWNFSFLVTTKILEFCMVLFLKFWFRIVFWNPADPLVYRVAFISNLFLVGNPQPPEPTFLPGKWHKLMHLVLTYYWTLINLSVNQGFSISECKFKFWIILLAVLNFAIRFQGSDALAREVTRLVRLNPLAVTHIPSAINYLVTAHSVEADAPEVISTCCPDFHNHPSWFKSHLYCRKWIHISKWAEIIRPSQSSSSQQCDSAITFITFVVSSHCYYS